MKDVGFRARSWLLILMKVEPVERPGAVRISASSVPVLLLKNG